MKAKSVDFYCPNCERSYQLTYLSLISNESGKEVEFSSLLCPSCEAVGLAPFGDIVTIEV